VIRYVRLLIKTLFSIYKPHEEICERQMCLYLTIENINSNLHIPIGADSVLHLMSKDLDTDVLTPKMLMKNFSVIQVLFNPSQFSGLKIEVKSNDFNTVHVISMFSSGIIMINGKKAIPIIDLYNAILTFVDTSKTSVIMKKYA